jgi:hypothetical protein
MCASIYHRNFFLSMEPGLPAAAAAAAAEQGSYDLADLFFSRYVINSGIS